MVHLPTPSFCYLMYDKPITNFRNFNNQKNSQVALLFFLGQEGFHEYGSDYVAISYVKGHVLFTWDLGAGNGTVINAIVLII